MRIAIVGGGVSGLVAAHLLQDRHEITVFEAGAYAGGHTNTIRVDTAHETHHVDTGFIVFNDRNYPAFTRLLARLGVEHQPSHMSFAVADERGDFEYSSGSVGGLFAKTSHAVSPTFQRMVLDYMRFNRKARELLADPAANPSLREWLEDCAFSRAFIERLIVPQASAVWSADPDQMCSFPARFLVEFFDNHGMLELTGRPKWMTVKGGSQRYVERLVRPFSDRLRLSCPVARIERFDDRVELTPVDGPAEGFDAVVLAVHSDQALRMLGDATRTEREVLGAIPYQVNEAVLHTDRGLLPRRRRAWSSWNYHLLSQPAGRPTVTYHMNRLQSLSASDEYCVTLNRTEAIAPEKVIRTISYAHPVFNAESAAAQKRHREVNGVQRTYYCGAYWGWGFHEDGVVSALRACAPLL
jgi:predicted NAD/FAD-binding protein